MSVDGVVNHEANDDALIRHLSQGDWTVLRELHLGDCDKCGKPCRAILMPTDNAKLGGLGLVESGVVYRNHDSTYSWLSPAGKDFMRRVYARFGFAGPSLSPGDPGSAVQEP
jgi:hypothetical protein